MTTPILIIADHTAEPDSFRGAGAGPALVEQLVAEVWAEGVKVIPLCPFVNAQVNATPNGRMLFRFDVRGPGQPPAAMTRKTQGSVTSWGGLWHRPCATCQAASTLGT